MLKIIPIVVSIFALALSGFTFFWTVLRRIHCLFLMQPSQMYYPTTSTSDGSLFFVFFNGGNNDVMITNINSYFRYNDSNHTTHHKIQFSSNEHPVLIGKGQGVKFNIKYGEGFPPNLATFLITPGVEPEKIIEVILDIEWINAYGEIYRKHIKIYDLKSTKKEKFAYKSLLEGKQINLYKAKSYSPK